MNWVISKSIRIPGPDSLYWNDADGWVDFESARIFTDEEHKVVRLPMEGRWLVTNRRTDAEIVEAIKQQFSGIEEKHLTEMEWTILKICNDVRPGIMPSECTENTKMIVDHHVWR